MIRFCKGIYRSRLQSIFAVTEELKRIKDRQTNERVVFAINFRVEIVIKRSQPRFDVGAGEKRWRRDCARIVLWKVIGLKLLTAERTPGSQYFPMTTFDCIHFNHCFVYQRVRDQLGLTTKLPRAVEYIPILVAWSLSNHPLCLTNFLEPHQT